jgi:hypothetical protein
MSSSRSTPCPGRIDAVADEAHEQAAGAAPDIEHIEHAELGVATTSQLGQEHALELVELEELVRTMDLRSRWTAASSPSDTRARSPVTATICDLEHAPTLKAQRDERRGGEIEVEVRSLARYDAPIAMSAATSELAHLFRALKALAGRRTQ